MKPRPESAPTDRLDDPGPVTVPPMEEEVALTNVADLLRRLASSRPDGLGLVDEDRRLTWGEVDATVDGLARGLAGLGLVAGHRVALVADNSVELVVGYLGALRGGLVAVPVNPIMPADDLRGLLQTTRPRVCFADAASIERVRTAVAGLDAPPLVVTISTEPRSGELALGELPSDGPRVVTPRDPEALAALFGSAAVRRAGSERSDHPRLAMLSHRALLANIDQVASTQPGAMTADDVVLGVQPLCSAYGLNAILGQVLRTGATLVLARHGDPRRALELARLEAATVVPVSSPTIVGWLDAPDLREAMSSVRLLWNGAGSLAEPTKRDFEARAGLVVQRGYGLAEAGPVVSSTFGSERGSPSSVGRPLPGVDVRVVDGAGEDVEPADTGEVWVRGRNLFSGYWPDAVGDPGPDGWLHTGEVGFLDGHGELFIADRVSELADVEGFSVYPSELEEVIGEVSGVRESAVVGLGGEGGSDVLVAFVVPAGAGADADALAAAVLAHCTERLARFKVPSRVEIVDRLPRSSTGAVVKDRLRASDPSASTEAP